MPRGELELLPLPGNNQAGTPSIGGNSAKEAYQNQRFKYVLESHNIIFKDV